MTIRERTLRCGLLALAAAGMLLACLVLAPTAGAQSGVDQYLEQVPNPEGDGPGDKDKKKDSSSGGGSGSGGSGGSGGSAGSAGSGSGDHGEAETEDELSEPGKKAAEEEQRKNDGKSADVPSADTGVTDGDNASAAALPGDGDEGGGGLSGGVIAFIALLLLGPAAFLIYRRFFAGQRQDGGLA